VRSVVLETPTNPTLKLVDIDRLSEAGHKAGAVVVVDGTFATPINQSPLALGADLVLHSASKYLGGHADALGGVICGRTSSCGGYTITARSTAQHSTPSPPISYFVA
jgi:cystathionine beta-lyase/cystathionine gamma-synthase